VIPDPLPACHHHSAADRRAMVVESWAPEEAMMSDLDVDPIDDLVDEIIAGPR